MSSEALYERYKDALRRGHIASIQGRVEEALEAYAQAARIAPERATPHSSAGAALLRRRRPAEALRSFDAALRLAPADETSLVGRAESLAALEHRQEAADAWSALADLRLGADRLADAVDAARRALELAEGRERRRTLERLISSLRAGEPDEPAREALEQALRVLEGMAVSSAPAPAADGAPVTRPADVARPPTPTPAPAPGASTSIPAAPAPPAAGPAQAAPATGSDPAGTPAVVVAATQPAAGPAAWAGPQTAAEPASAGEPVPPAPRVRTVRATLDRDLVGTVDLERLAVSADEAMDLHDARRAVERLLDLATAQRRAGNRDAALDACYIGLAIAPDDIGLHLALVELYAERGWSAVATEKLDLLGRIAEIDDDASARERVAAERVAPV